MFASMSSFVRTVRLQDRELRVRVDEQGSLWRIDAGDGVREVSVLEVEPGVYSILIDGNSYEVRAADLTIEVEDPRAPRSAHKQASLEGRQSVSAAMPGKVVKVLVSMGDAVERGQGLVVIEAMKMQNEMKSPKQGRVVAITTVEGATVAPGEVLATVE
jgi:biotin carboxyl carrier protein